MKRTISDSYFPEFQDSTYQQQDLEVSGTEDGQSDYVSVLVRYDSFKFEKDLNRTTREGLFDKSSEYYSNILNVSSFDGTSGSYSCFDGFRDLIRARTFDLSDPHLDSQPSYDDISDDYEISMVSDHNCDICFGLLANESTSRCRRCKVAAHTNCLLNSCNTVTELTPITNTAIEEPKKLHNPSSNVNLNSNLGQKHYEFTCKICLLRMNPVKKPHCIICNLQGGIINYTEKIYYHPFCVYYSYDVLYPYFNNNMSLSNSTQFKKHIQTQTQTQNTSVKEKTGQKQCIICTDHLGVTMKCSFPNCNDYLHPRCIINSYKDELNRKSPRNVSESIRQNEGVVIFLVINYQSTLGNRSTVFKGCFCGSHMNKKYVNYTIYKQLINQSIVVPKNRTTYNKYKQVIDNILKQYFNKKEHSSSLDDINFTIDTNSKMPNVNTVPVTISKKRRLNDILGEIKSRVSDDDEISDEKVEQKSRESSKVSIDEVDELILFEHEVVSDNNIDGHSSLEKDINCEILKDKSNEKEKDKIKDNKEKVEHNNTHITNIKENKEQTTKVLEGGKEDKEKEKQDSTNTKDNKQDNKIDNKDKRKEGIIKKDDKDKKDEEELKVQKVLVQKFDIFNPIRFDPFTSHLVPSGVNHSGQYHKDIHCNRDPQELIDDHTSRDTHTNLQRDGYASNNMDGHTSKDSFNKNSGHGLSQNQTIIKNQNMIKSQSHNIQHSQNKNQNYNLQQSQIQDKNQVQAYNIQQNNNMNQPKNYNQGYASNFVNTSSFNSSYTSSLSNEIPKVVSPRNQVNKNDSSTSLSSVLLYNKENKDNILPLNSILFDNIKTNKELALCYQQQILSSCTGIIEYMNVLNENLFRRDEDENYLYVLFENAIDNYMMIYSFGKKMLSTININEFNTQMQLDLKSLLSNSMVKESALKENAMFNNVNMYGIKDDIKYINSISSTGMVGSSLGGTTSFKNRSLYKKLKLVKYIKLNTFELEMLKKSILELRNMNYIKLIVFNQMTNVHSGHGTNGGFGVVNRGIEEKYINYIDWNKIINNIKNMYDNNNITTPMKYDEYRLLSHLNPDLIRNVELDNKRAKDNFLKNEYGLIENELSDVNQKLVDIKNKLHEKILNYCSNYYMDHEKLLMNKHMLNMYESNEYYYHIIHNLSKLFSRSNRLLNLPEIDETNRKNRRIEGKRLYGAKESIYNEYNTENMYISKDRKDDEEGKYCQICYNEEENNINVLVKCTRCLIVVHKYCYNIPISKIVRNTEYLCNRCEYEKKQLSSQYQSNYKKFSILCNICKRGSGPLSRNKEDWYHPFCYLVVLLVSSPNGLQAKNMGCVIENVANLAKMDLGFVDNREFGVENMGKNKGDDYKDINNKENNEVDMDNYNKEQKKQEKGKEDFMIYRDNRMLNNKKGSKKEKKKRCIVCCISEGILIDCNKCSNKFHPFCAYFQGFQFKLIKGSNSTRLKVSCNIHFSLTNVVQYGRKGSKYNEQIIRNELYKKDKENTNNKDNEKNKDNKEKEDKENDMIMEVIRNRYKRYINRDISDTIYDKDKKKRIIHTSSNMEDYEQYKENEENIEKTCSICYKDNAEISCVKCDKHIHKSCYILEIKEEFKCDVCSYKEEENNKDKEIDVYCNICLNNEDLLVRSYDRNFFHIICQIFYNCSDFNEEGVYYNPDYSKEGIFSKCKNMNIRLDVRKEENMENNKEDNKINEINNKENMDNYNKEHNKQEKEKEEYNENNGKERGCNICSSEYGFMIYCYKKDCNVKFHPNCAAKHDLVLEPYFTSKGMKYISLCQEHSLLHNTIGQNLKSILKTRIQIMMIQDIFKDIYHQNILIKSILRKRKEIYNELYPLNEIFCSPTT